MRKFTLLTVLLSALAGTLPFLSRAAEISYPSFFAIDKATSIGDLIQIFYTGLLGIGAIVVAGYIVFLGFQVLASRGNPGAGSRLKERVGRILLGLALLLGGVVLIRAINPELATLQVGPLVFGTPPQITQLPTITQPHIDEISFSDNAIGQDLNAADIFLNKVDDDPSLENTNHDKTLKLLQERASALETDLASCSAGLCQGPGPGQPYTQRNSHAGPPPYSTCDAATCTGDICTGDPCAPGRSDANSKLGNPAADEHTAQTVVGTFRDLQYFWGQTLQLQRDALIACANQPQRQQALLTYADALSAAQNASGSATANEIATKCSSPNIPCQESSDFFCENPVTSRELYQRLHLSLDDPATGNGLLQKEEAFIRMLNGFSNSLLPPYNNGVYEDITSCSCLNTSWACPDSGYCSQATGQCSNNRYPEQATSGCYANTWTDLNKLMELKRRMEILHDQLKTAITNVNQVGQDEIISSSVQSTPVQGLYIENCTSAKTIANIPCPQTTSSTPTLCCPDETTRHAITTCAIEDFFSCIIPPSASSP